MGQISYMQTVVEVNSVEKSYGQAQVIRQCSFQLYKGKTYGLLGVNGAGKTTLMKMILGLQKADGGSIQEKSSCVIQIDTYFSMY